ncbi:MAG TPA: flagellar protein FliS [Pirellulaceae bacterium]|nr:flagellar protein FliS [Pirellulaceae bacterium]HMO91955.1 flagellar protein FliS [Pirellulaceae bacterium]HMP68754.1 flagellar protein FliS [Pirellulaceae bacterium]
MKPYSYNARTIIQGWTRIDMLLALYDRAIASIRAAAHAKQHDDSNAFWEKTLFAQKCLLAIHSGLKPEEHDVAFNISRLVHFAMSKLCDHEFEIAIETLESIRASYEAIREEATQLEHQGTIPALDFSNSLTTTV